MIQMGSLECFYAKIFTHYLSDLQPQILQDHAKMHDDFQASGGPTFSRWRLFFFWDASWLTLTWLF